MLTTWSRLMLMAGTPSGRTMGEREGYHCVSLLRPRNPPMRIIASALPGAALAAVALAATAATPPAAGTAETSPMADNPFAQPSTLPFQMPPFARIHDSDYLPAFAAALHEQLAEVAAIAHNPQPPTFENTVVALERSGQMRVRIEPVFSNLNTCNTDPQMQKIDTEMAPKLTAQNDAIFLDAALWARIDQLYQQRATAHLDPESLQLLSRYHTLFVRAGARLAPAQQAQLKELNKQISSLTTRFRQNVLKATADGAVAVASAAELDGLSSEDIGAAAQAAAARGLKGKWLITLQNNTNQAVLAQLKNRPLRERIYRASISRALSGASDNRPVVAQLVKLRAERATLLGYPRHAAYVLADESAGTPQAVRDMIGQVAPAAGGGEQDGQGRPRRSGRGAGRGGRDAEAHRRPGGRRRHRDLPAAAVG